MGAKAPKTPKAPRYDKTYQQGIDVFLKNLPTMLGAEQTARTQQDPQRIAEQQALQTQFGPAQYQQQLDALHQLDPASAQIRNQLATAVSGDLASGYGLPAGYRTELLNSIRGAQTARGNAMGNSASADETGYLGQAMLQLYQQHLENAGKFLSSPTPEQQLLSVQSVSPDRTSQYVNPNAGTAGAQFALTNYQNLLAQQAASGAGQNPWASALGGAASGAATGSMLGPYGAVAGGLIGGAAGYFSDIRTKENIQPLGNGLYRFNYKLHKARKFVGVLAHEVKDFARRSGKGFMADFFVVPPMLAPVEVR